MTSMAIREKQLFKVFGDWGPSTECTVRQYKVNPHMNGTGTTYQDIGNGIC